jgi:hypothetical protein
MLQIALSGAVSGYTYNSYLEPLERLLTTAESTLAEAICKE